MLGFKKISMAFLKVIKKSLLSFLPLIYWCAYFKKRELSFDKLKNNYRDKKLEIIILHWNRLGDALLLTPTIRAIKNDLPSSVLSVATKDKGAYEVLKNNPYIDNLKLLNSWLKVFKFIFKNTKKTYTVLLDLSLVHFYHSFLFRCFFKAKIRIGLENHQKIGFFKLNNFNKLYDKVVEYNVKKPYLADYFLSSLKFINIINANNQLDFFPETVSKNYQYFEAPSRPYILIHPGTRNLENAYLNWDKLIDKIISTYSDYSIVIIGQIKEFNIIRFPYQKLKNKYKNIHFISNISLSQLSKLTDGASLFLGLDSGITHLAIARKVKVLVIFGRADFKLYTPDRENIKVILPRDKMYPFFTFYDFFSCPKVLGFCTHSVPMSNILRQVKLLLIKDT